MSSKLVLAALYFGLGLVYIVLTGVDLPGKLDDFLHHHHNISYMIIGTLYILIAMVKLLGFKYSSGDKYGSDDKTSDNKDDQSTSKTTDEIFGIENIVIFLVILFTLYCWVKLMKGKDLTYHKRSFRLF